MYVRSKPTKKGYQKRLKAIWDERFPIHDFTAKHLAQQVSNIKKKNLLNETERRLIEIQLCIPGEHNATGENVNPGEQEYIGEHAPRENDALEENDALGEHDNSGEHDAPGVHITPGDHNEPEEYNEPGEQAVLGEHNEPGEHNEQGEHDEPGSHITPGDHNTLGEHTIPGEHDHQEEHNDPGETEQKDLREELIISWRDNFKKYIELDIHQREYSTKTSPPPSMDLLKIVDEIISEEIVNIEKNYEIDLWTINVIYYTTAVTVLQKEGKLRKRGRKQKQKEKPGWQIRLESRIQAVRRKLSYTHVLIECHKSKKYTKHQKKYQV